MPLALLTTCLSQVAALILFGLRFDNSLTNVSCGKLSWACVLGTSASSSPSPAAANPRMRKLSKAHVYEFVLPKIMGRATSAAHGRPRSPASATGKARLGQLLSYQEVAQLGLAPRCRSNPTNPSTSFIKGPYVKKFLLEELAVQD